MKEQPKKLVLHQETLKNLSEDAASQKDAFFGTKTCVPTQCSPFSCTLAPC
jgi:hypothetical protein